MKIVRNPSVSLTKMMADGMSWSSSVGAKRAGATKAALGGRTGQ